jgi:hypothetical protein
MQHAAAHGLTVVKNAPCTGDRKQRADVQDLPLHQHDITVNEVGTRNGHTQLVAIAFYNGRRRLAPETLPWQEHLLTEQFLLYEDSQIGAVERGLIVGSADIRFDL